jgi:hypothetical protein
MKNVMCVLIFGKNITRIFYLTTRTQRSYYDVIMLRRF